MTTLTIRVDIPEYASPEEIFKLLDQWQEDMQSEDVSLSDAEWMTENGGIHYWNP